MKAAEKAHFAQISQPFMRDNSRNDTVFSDAEVGAALAATLRHHGSYLVPRSREKRKLPASRSSRTDAEQ